MRVSFDVEELIAETRGGQRIHLQLSPEDFTKVSGIRKPAKGDAFCIENLSFTLKPSITDTLRKLVDECVSKGGRPDVFVLTKQQREQLGEENMCRGGSIYFMNIEVYTTSNETAPPQFRYTMTLSSAD